MTKVSRIFIFDKLSADGVTEFWRWENKNDSCRGRIHETNGRKTIVIELVHEPDSGRIQAYIAVIAPQRIDRCCSELSVTKC